MSSAFPDISLGFLDRTICVRCEDATLRALLQQNFAAMPTPAARCDLRLTVSGTAPGPFLLRQNASEESARLENTGDLICELETRIVVWLQLQRPDYVFIHSAALVRHDVVHLLVGRSGAGKSTTAFGLTSYGFALSTDEMIAVHPFSGDLETFRHAVCLKRAPPDGHSLPEGTVRSTRGFHIPLEALGGAVPVHGLPVASIICMEHDPEAAYPEIRRCEAAEAVTRLYPNILNALAHADEGLGAASRIVRGAQNYLMTTARLRESCELIRETLDQDRQAFDQNRRAHDEDKHPAGR